MAEVNLFFCSADRDKFAEWCLDRDYVIIPDQDYDENSYLLIKSKDDYFKYMKKCVRFYIVHQEFKRFPLEMQSFKKYDKLVYYIRQRYGGPSIDFYTPLFAELDEKEVGLGAMGIYPFYYHYDDKFKAGVELKNSFSLFSKYIQNNAKKVKIGNSIFWIGDHSIEQYRKGKLDFVEMGGFDWKILLRE